MLERRSGLATALAQGGRDGANGQRACRLGEIRGWSLLQVAAFVDTLAQVEAILARHLGASPPERAGIAIPAGERLMLKTGPEQFWILGGEADELGEAMAADVGGAIGALTSLSHSRTRLFIEGPPARDVLAKGFPLDLHPDLFKPGDFALTGLHHTPVLFMRATRERYEIWATRSFALTLFDWLADAAWPVGYDIQR